MGEQDDDITLPGETRVDIQTESATPNPNETPEQKAQREADEKVLALMLKRYKTTDAAWTHYRTNAIEDAKFRAGTWGKKSFQWIPSIQQEREDDGRPCLTINRAPGFVHQVTNGARQARLRIQVNPVDDHGDPKVAEVLGGIIRNIETQSLADWQYARGSDKQAEQGLGFLRIVTEWAVDNVGAIGARGTTADLFRQRVKIKGERNPLRILLDPAYEEPDAADAAFAFKVTDIDRGDFKDAMGVDAPSEDSVAAFLANGSETGDWFPNGKIRVVEYFAKESRGEKVRKALLSNGDVINYPTDAQRGELEKLGVTVIRDRYLQNQEMIWRKCTALKIYETTTWPDKSQPWVPVMGDELEIEGERDFRGVIRDSKDAARVYNAEVSALVEGVASGIKAPVIGYKGQFGAENSPQRNAWKEANRKRHAFLEVDPMDIDGKPAPFPQPITFEPPLQGTVMAIHQADTDYKSTAGFRDASLGERGPQESGVAISARQRQDELGSSHYLDNLRLALCGVGRRLVPVIRIVYDVPTVIRITGDDNKQKRVMVFSGAHNDPRQDKFLMKHPQTQQPVPFALPDGVSGIYDLNVGEYDIEIAAGQNSGSRRQEALQSIAEIFKGLPPEYSMKFMDLMFSFVDGAAGHQLAERAKKLLPPELQDEDESGGQPPIPPQAMQAMKQQLEQTAAALQQLQGDAAVQREKINGQILIERLKIKSRMLEQHEELASRERIEALKLTAQLLQQEVEQKSEHRLTLLQAEIDRQTQIANQTHDVNMAAIDAAEADADRQHALDLQAAQPPPGPPPADTSATPAAQAPPAAPAAEAGA